MQLGDCLFDSQRGLLTHQVTQEQWFLPRAELQVLRLLIANHDKVVAKHVLGSADAEHLALSDSSVTRAVFMLRSFLGPAHEHMIETIKGKGYRLRLESQSRKRIKKPSTPVWVSVFISRLFGCQHRRIKLGVGLLILAIIPLVVMQWMGQFSNHSTYTEPFSKQVITLESGQKVMLISYAKSKTNNTSLLALTQRLAQGIKLCESAPWKQVYLSLSHDKQVFNITMKGDKLGQSIVRNLKLTDFRQNKVFISDQWLAEVSLCE
ncbi:winged helix-turn-helix domain-containing protein [Shewanella psychrotolerans]|uniref:winged helix-turn-helix domain-containing protein n=1 Tax=Shewanella psychrotolerans TaxID=2864206 RepID=UPI001C65795E|nr:helix-turn-helix domain-containing protein [Shewanella psychrotolerans]QYK00804.1 helix-turn-helix domain-containing protein [Shewanella psychrotolerans]